MLTYMRPSESTRFRRLIVGGYGEIKGCRQSRLCLMFVAVRAYSLKVHDDTLEAPRTAADTGMCPGSEYRDLFNANEAYYQFPSYQGLVPSTS